MARELVPLLVGRVTGGTEDTRWQLAGEEIAAAIAADVERRMRAEHERVEAALVEGLVLTAPEYRHRIVLVSMVGDDRTPLGHPACVLPPDHPALPAAHE